MSKLRIRFIIKVALSLAVCALSTYSAIPQVSSSNGLTVISQQTLDTRLFTVQLTSAALPGPTNVRILLPAGYSSADPTRYPVLYLLHGTSGSNTDWTTSGNAESVTAGLPLIVVMPDIALKASGGGWCTNWPNGLYKWETYHIDQLLPWVDSNLRTIPGRATRAIAGLSQGGFCSTSYGARHPDLFGTVLSFSGATDIALGADAIALTTVTLNVTETLLDGVPANSIFGDRAKNEINWAAHDPATLAPNFRATNLFLFHGNGQAGPLDTLATIPSGAVEAGVNTLNIDFHKRLTALGIANSYDDYGNGTHSWPYWNRDLQQSITPLMNILTHPAAPPSQITFTNADNAYSVYGWDVTMNRFAREFSTLANASCAGFVLSGSGSATVVTPPCFTPGKTYQVSLSGKSSNVTAPPDGRLTLNVPLGPSNLFQQFTLEADILGTHVYSTTATITP